MKWHERPRRGGMCTNWKDSGASGLRRKERRENRMQLLSLSVEKKAARKNRNHAKKINRT